MEHNPFSLEDKTILVTGAASGIGKAIAFECAYQGAKLVLLDMNEAKLTEVISLMPTNGHLMYVVNLTNHQQLSNAVEQFPKLDGIASNAGVVRSLVAQYSEKKDAEDIFNINSISHIDLIQTILNYKKLKKGASIVFTSSMSGVFCGAVGGALYGASKAAIYGYSKALALELAPKNIRVNTVNPGMIHTGIFENTSISEEEFKEDMKHYPLKRYGRPEEVAYAVVYLLSDATQWMTGTALLIDGGYSVQ
jgi:NAD(P)-dependent dehydrogenase (short-subunit alcohol dehydrogenase family)